MKPMRNASGRFRRPKAKEEESGAAEEVHEFEEKEKRIKGDDKGKGMLKNALFSPLRRVPKIACSV